jgi:hypothetical protein
MIELLAHPVLSRSLALGLLGGIGLALTTVLSRRGPVILPVYAAFLGATAFLLALYSEISYRQRFLAAMAAFVVAASIHYVTVGLHANRQRRRLQPRYPEIRHTVPLIGHVWRLSILTTMGLIASAGLAFLTSP